MTDPTTTRAELDATHEAAVENLRRKREHGMKQARRVALAHVRALRRSARAMPWWKRLAFWVSIERGTR